MVAFGGTRTAVAALGLAAITASAERGQPDGAQPTGVGTEQRSELVEANVHCAAGGTRAALRKALMQRAQSDSPSAAGENQSTMSSVVAAVTGTNVASLVSGVRAEHAPESGSIHSKPTIQLGGIGVQDFGPADRPSWDDLPIK